MFDLQPILAAPDVGGLLGIAFLIISFIGWISNIVSKQQQQPPQQRPRGPQNRKVRDEIEAFLQEATGQGRRRPPQNVDDVEILDADEIEVVSTPQKQRPRPSRPQPVRQRPKPRQLAQPSRPAAGQPSSGQKQSKNEVANRHMQDSHFGESLTQHVQSHMVERVGQQASQNTDPTVDDSVAAHMGEFMDGESAARRRRSSSTPEAAELLKMLRNPQGVKQAYILGEVLHPPLALRRKRP